LHIVVPGQADHTVSTRLHEISAAYVRSFVFKNFNPFIEGGPSIFLFQPIRNMHTTTYDVHRQTQLGAMYGVGIAYEISPSFDIRAEYRGLVTKVPNFNNTLFSTNKWYNIYNPTIGVAYHF
jgi:opacity protein-like surface antigen